MSPYQNKDTANVHARDSNPVPIGSFKIRMFYKELNVQSFWFYTKGSKELDVPTVFTHGKKPDRSKESCYQLCKQVMFNEKQSGLFWETDTRIPFI
jgi:hypothetical protein